MEVLQFLNFHGASFWECSKQVQGLDSYMMSVFCLSSMMKLQDSTQGMGWLLDDGDMLWGIVFKEQSAGGECRAELYQ